MSTASPPPVLECPCCGAIIPGHVPTQIENGRAFRACQRCGHHADLTEVMV